MEESHFIRHVTKRKRKGQYKFPCASCHNSGCPLNPKSVLPLIADINCGSFFASLDRIGFECNYQPVPPRDIHPLFDPD